MADLYEIDFLQVANKSSADAIVVYYEISGVGRLHVVDAGFRAVGVEVLNHIDQYHGHGRVIDHALLTHPDGDHAGGMVEVIKSGRVNNLWMLRPWEYADELLPRFSTYTSRDRLVSALKSAFPLVCELEKEALENGVQIMDPFQGAWVGQFLVLAPTKEHYLNMIVQTGKTPATKEQSLGGLGGVRDMLIGAVKEAVKYVFMGWGEERFSSEETSEQNEMSVVQYMEIDGQSVILTGDVGRKGLRIAIDYIKSVGIDLSNLRVFQVPHHGSRRNVESEILDELLGPRIADQNRLTGGRFTAVVSCSKENPNHPRKAVVRAMIHRDGKVLTTEEAHICCSHNMRAREGWGAANCLPYPSQQEE